VSLSRNRPSGHSVLNVELVKTFTSKWYFVTVVVVFMMVVVVVVVVMVVTVVVVVVRVVVVVVVTVVVVVSPCAQNSTHLSSLGSHSSQRTCTPIPGKQVPAANN